MLRIAKILKSHGVDGAVLVSAPEFDPADFSEPVLIYFDGLPVPFFIEESSPRGVNRYIIRLTDVSCLKDAEEMAGRDIFIESDESAGTDDGYDFTGWKVYDKGTPIGEVNGMEPIPGNLCLYVGDIMIPLHEDFMESADPDTRELFLSLPEGLY
jgi:16S rRNA processing protein RimM